MSQTADSLRLRFHLGRPHPKPAPSATPIVPTTDCVLGPANNRPALEAAIRAVDATREALVRQLAQLGPIDDVNPPPEQP